MPIEKVQHHLNHHESLKDNISYINLDGEFEDFSSSHYHSIIGREKRMIKFGMMDLVDDSEHIHIPFTKEGNAIIGPKTKFKSDDYDLLGRIQPNPDNSKELHIQVFKKSIDGDLSKENTLIDCHIDTSKSTEENIQYLNTSKKLSQGKTLSILQQMKLYMQSYFRLEKHQEHQRKIDDIHRREILDKEQEGDVEAILERW